jgi:hypothetical protein
MTHPLFLVYDKLELNDGVNFHLILTNSKYYAYDLERTVSKLKHSSRYRSALLNISWHYKIWLD